MPDFEIHAPNDAIMVAAAQALGGGLWNAGNPDLNIQPGINTGGINAAGVLWAVNYYGTKRLPTGNLVADRFGNQVPEYAALPGVYAILRWEGDISILPAPPEGSGVSIIPLPADSPVVFA